MTRPRKTVRRRKVHISLPEDLIGAIENQFFDPIRQRPQYGIFAILVSGLLRKWLVDPSIYPISVVNFPEVAEREEELASTPTSHPGVPNA